MKKEKVSAPRGKFPRGCLAPLRRSGWDHVIGAYRQISSRISSRARRGFHRYRHRHRGGHHYHRCRGRTDRLDRCHRWIRTSQTGRRYRRPCLSCRLVHRCRDRIGSCRLRRRIRQHLGCHRYRRRHPRHH